MSDWRVEVQQGDPVFVLVRSNALLPTATDIGLGNVDNTSDANKPVSTAQSAAIAVVQADIDAHQAAEVPHEDYDYIQTMTQIFAWERFT